MSPIRARRACMRLGTAVATLAWLAGAIPTPAGEPPGAPAAQPRRTDACRRGDTGRGLLLLSFLVPLPLPMALVAPPDTRPPADPAPRRASPDAPAAARDPQRGAPAETARR